MLQVTKGDLVQVHYTGKLSDGEEFDSSRDEAPLKVEIGAGQLIQGFEDGLMGMSIGESKINKFQREAPFHGRSLYL